MPDEDGVTPSESPTEPATPPEPEVDLVLPADRPAQNIKAEFDRKFGQLSAQQNQIRAGLDAITNWIASQGRPASAAPAAGTPSLEQMSNDELWAEVQKGNKLAFEAWTNRNTDQRVQMHTAAQNREALNQGQINVLLQRYPALADPSHALSQAADQAYRYLTGMGHPPTRATILEAMKTAIADNPEIIAQLHTGAPAREGTRRSATEAARAGQTGASHREGSPRAAKPQVSPAQAALARRMGVKDPAAAIERFHSRQEAGTSQLGAVAAFVREEL